MYNTYLEVLLLPVSLYLQIRVENDILKIQRNNTVHVCDFSGRLLVRVGVMGHVFCNLWWWSHKQEQDVC